MIHALFTRVATGAAVCGLLGALVAWRSSTVQAPADVQYPEDYRSWTHVKSAFLGPAHEGFQTRGGFQHIYANVRAMEGYRTRQFPEGSVVVFDWLETQDTGRNFVEGSRRQIDVMVKDSSRFSATGGWGFQRFVKDSRTERAAEPSPRQCFTCHLNLKADGLVISRYRQ